MKAKGFCILPVLLLAAMVAGACGAGGAGERRVSVSSVHSPRADVHAPGGGGDVSSRVYSAPDNAFAIRISDGWRVERNEKDGAYMTVIRPEQYSGANLSIMTINGVPDKSVPAELKSTMLVESSKPFFEGWLNGLREEARVEVTRDIYSMRLGDFDALGLDVNYYRQDAGDPHRGHCVFLIGEKTTFFIAMTGSRTRFNELEEIISTIHIEP